MSSFIRYKNGNYTCAIDLDNGTKFRCNDKDCLVPEFPESMDITISKKCNMGCAFCYAGCTPGGEHADIMSDSFIDGLHPYTELALNGNEPLHPDLIPFLEKCKKLKLIPSLTVNQYTFEKNIDLLKELCDKKMLYGIGISMNDANHEFVEKVKMFPNAVIHVINGIVTIQELNDISKNGIKILILGYKSVNRGTEYNDKFSSLVTWRQYQLKSWIEHIIYNEWFEVVAFDNLAIEQLDIKNILTEKEFSEFYCGDDGQFTMYIDMVDGYFAKNSMSDAHYDLLDSAKDMFDVVRSESQHVDN